MQRVKTNFQSARPTGSEPPRGAMVGFAHYFPEVAEKETRMITLLEPWNGLAAGGYMFFEFFCPDPKCDCRRAMIQVWRTDALGTTLATINYGWESLEFYTRWMHGMREAAREMVGVTLYPMAPQTRFAPALVSLFRTTLMPDEAYLARIQRHYQLMKTALPKKTPPPAPKLANTWSADFKEWNRKLNQKEG